jgi:hypothetical protein
VLIFRDLLDAKLRDAYHREIGRVDGVVLELSGDGPPRVSRLECGSPVAWLRVGRPLSSLARTLRRWGPRQLEPARFPWAAVTRSDDSYRLTVDADLTPAMAFELWLREHVVFRIPFSGRKR